MLGPARVRNVHEVQQQAAVADFFERGPKRGKQSGWQVANKADRVVDYYFLLARQAQAARRRIERGKHSLFGAHVAVGERVEQRRLAGVGIPDDRNYRKLIPGSYLSSFLTPLALRLDVALEAVDAIANTAAIHLQFCFTGTAPADAAGQARKGGILSGDQPRQEILQLSELHLNLTFA